jgi:prolyl-tRNA synthetase
MRNAKRFQGVPLRIELGPKDIAKSKFVAARRDTMKKETYDEQDFVATVKNLLDQIQNDLYLKYRLSGMSFLLFEFLLLLLFLNDPNRIEYY